MVTVSTKGQVTIPKSVREELGIRPGDEVTFTETDEVTFTETDEGFVIETEYPTTAEGDDPFEVYRGAAESDATMPERMRELRGEYPRTPPEELDG